MLRSIGTNISVITNFGCHSNCWYCVWKDHPLRDVKLDTDWDQLRAFLQEHRDKGKVSVSGGGDCLYEYDTYSKWWWNFFALCDELDLEVDVHSREKFPNPLFWKKVNRCVASSDKLADDRDYFTWILGRTNLRIVHVVTAATTIEGIQEYLDFQEEFGCQFTIKELVGYDDNGNYQMLKGYYPDLFALDAGDYNIYYMPDNTVTDVFMMPEEKQDEG